MTTEQAVVGGIPLVYEREGSGPPIVFLHGGNASAVYWEALVPLLIDDHTVYLLESRGHGRSGRAADGAYSMRIFRDEAAAFVEAVTGPAVLVGQSQGGGAAWGVATIRPDLVRGVLSEDMVPAGQTIATLSGPHPIISFFAAAKEHVERSQREGQSIARFASNLATIPVGRGTYGTWVEPNWLYHFARCSYQTDPAWYGAVTRADTFGWTDEEAIAMASGIRCPVHVAHGNPRRGGLVTAGHLKELEAQGVDLTSTYYEDAGHEISSRLPRAFHSDLREFLARVESSA